MSGGHTLVLADVPGSSRRPRGCGLGIEFLRHLSGPGADPRRGLLRRAAEARRAIEQVVRSWAHSALSSPSGPPSCSQQGRPARGGEAAGELEPEFPGSHRISAQPASAPAIFSMRPPPWSPRPPRRRRPTGEAGRAQGAGEADAAAGGHRVYRQSHKRPGRRGWNATGRGLPGHRPAVCGWWSAPTSTRRRRRGLHRRLAAAGVDAALGAAGCQDGNTVRIGSAEFTFAADAMSSVPRPPAGRADEPHPGRGLRRHLRPFHVGHLAVASRRGTESWRMRCGWCRPGCPHRGPVMAGAADVWRCAGRRSRDAPHLRPRPGVEPPGPSTPSTP